MALTTDRTPDAVVTFGPKIKLNKTAMARVIVKALYNRQSLPPVDDVNVQAFVRRHNTKQLETLYGLANKALASVAIRKMEKGGCP